MELDELRHIVLERNNFFMFQFEVRIALPALALIGQASEIGSALFHASIASDVWR